jgi:hypothetical protein
MSQAAVPRRRLRVFGETQRKDAWWAPQAITFVVISVALVYIHWALFQGEHYDFGPYLSPLYSPVLWGSSHHAIFGEAPAWFPSWYSPAMIILVFPAGFRFTCYYYRGAYYKAFWADPPGCTVGEPRKSYLGEKSFPLILQNIHRYFMYAAVVYIFILSYDAIRGFFWEDGFHIGLGALVLSVNAFLLGGYTFGCHSFRHLIGGKKDTLPKSAVGKSCYEGCSALNRRHMLFAWMSLFWVMFTDIYIRLCSMEVITDFRIF